jgi:hypothetical protein
MILKLCGNADIEVFPFKTFNNPEVILRHLDNESQDIELTPDEAEVLAAALSATAAAVRKLK